MPETMPPLKPDTTGPLRDSSPVSIGEEVSVFVKQIDSLSTSLLLALKVLTTVRDKVSESMTKFFDKHGTLLQETEGFRSYSVATQHSSKSESLKKQFDHAEFSLTILPRSFLFSLVTQFEAYFARLLRALYHMKPEMLNPSDTILSFAKLLELNSIDAAKEYLLEKEIGAVLRKSPLEQFTWLENKFEVSIRKELMTWPAFNEAVERNNHFVYRNGIISSQYIDVCKRFGVPLDRTFVVGGTLPVNQEYFDAAYRSVYEIAVKVAQLLWRRLQPDDLEAADKNLFSITHELIALEKFNLAIILLDFAALTVKKHFNEESRRAFIINRAQAYKWNRQENICSLILSKDDWAGQDERFQLAVAVLNDDFALAARIMEKIGAGSAQDASYRDWPLFKEFRKSPEFLQTYEKIFNKPFVTIALVPKLVA
jgi:hypothetical protein